PHKNNGYALLYGTFTAGNPGGFSYAELDRVISPARDIDYTDFVMGLAGVSAAVGSTTGTVHIVWDCDNDLIKVFQKKPGGSWITCTVKESMHTTGEKQPFLRIYLETGTISVAEVVYVAQSVVRGVYYTQVWDGREIAPITLLYQGASAQEQLFNPVLEKGYVFWSGMVAPKKTEVYGRQIPVPGTTTPVENISSSP
ncbi:MAG: hypothetical protein ACP5QG_09655, partial [candidate division WOR-3 bacterium]